MAAAFIVCRTASKLKHILLRQIYYQLINTCLMFSYASWRKCSCYKFSGID